MMNDDGVFKFLPKGDDGLVNFLNPFLRLTRIEKNKQIIEDTFLWMQQVWDNFKDGDLPMRPEGATKSKMPCTYCPIKKECYAKTTPIGTVEIDLFEVPKI